MLWPRRTMPASASSGAFGQVRRASRTGVTTCGGPSKVASRPTPRDAPRKRTATHDCHPHPLRRALDVFHLRPDLFHAPLRGAPDVHHEPLLGTLFLPVRLCGAGTVVSRPARLRHPPPSAPH